MHKRQSPIHGKEPKKTKSNKRKGAPKRAPFPCNSSFGCENPQDFPDDRIFRFKISERQRVFALADLHSKAAAVKLFDKPVLKASARSDRLGRGDLVSADFAHLFGKTQATLRRMLAEIPVYFTSLTVERQHPGNVFAAAKLRKSLRFGFAFGAKSAEPCGGGTGGEKLRDG